jgi:hypothetical protein
MARVCVASVTGTIELVRTCVLTQGFCFSWRCRERQCVYECFSSRIRFLYGCRFSAEGSHLCHLDQNFLTFLTVHSLRYRKDSGGGSSLMYRADVRPQSHLFV